VQLSDYDSAYAQQRVDVNAYNTKQEGLQRQIEAQQQQQYGGDGYNTEGYNESYGDGYDYASPGEIKLICEFLKVSADINGIQ